MIPGSENDVMNKNVITIKNKTTLITTTIKPPGRFHSVNLQSNDQNIAHIDVIKKQVTKKYLFSCDIITRPLQ